MTSTPPQTGSGTDTRDALAEVLDDQARRRTRREEASTRRVKRRLGWSAVVALGAVTVWLWLAPPAIVRPVPPPAPSPAQMVTGLRMDMWVVAASVERARAPDGTVPLSLDGVLEDPAEGEGVRYLRTGSDSYRLIGVRDGLEVRWDSSEGLEALLAAPDAVTGTGSPSSADAPATDGARR